MCLDAILAASLTPRLRTGNDYLLQQPGRERVTRQRQVSPRPLRVPSPRLPPAARRSTASHRSSPLPPAAPVAGLPRPGRGPSFRRDRKSRLSGGIGPPKGPCTVLRARSLPRAPLYGTRPRERRSPPRGEKPPARRLLVRCPRAPAFETQHPLCGSRALCVPIRFAPALYLASFETRSLFSCSGRLRGGRRAPTTKCVKERVMSKTRPLYLVRERVAGLL